jgi:hypothetical protein
MAPAKAYRQLPAASRSRGFPSIGFEIVPGDLEITPVPAGDALLLATETRDGKAVGELEVTVFSAALVIDRDGILEAKASDSTGGAHAVPVVLPGASGYFAETRGDAQLPYRYVFAIAPHDLAVDGGVLVTVRSARPDWPAADRLLQSLRIITRHGTAPANDDARMNRAAAAPILPFVPPLGRDE